MQTRRFENLKSCLYIYLHITKRAENPKSYYLVNLKEKQVENF